MDTVSNAAVSPSQDSWYVAHNLIMKFTISKALEAVLKLGIAELLANSEGKKPLSAKEILALLPTKSTPGPVSVVNLQRLLTPLVSEGLFSESLSDEKEPLYGMTDISRWFLKGNKLSVLPTAEGIFIKEFAETFNYVHEVILDENTTTFLQAHGQPAFEVMKKNPEIGRISQASMSAHSQAHLASLLDSLVHTGVLDGVNSLVDVGGGRGLTVGQIVAQNPHIRGINFDLPQVIAIAPAIPGVQHVGGSFLKSVPSGDAMLLKTFEQKFDLRTPSIQGVIHMYDDEHSIKILKNCFEAIPENGKVIVAEFFKMKNNQTARARYIECLDLLLVGTMKGSRERGEEEYRVLLVAAGFQRPSVIPNPGSIDMIQAYKE